MPCALAPLLPSISQDLIRILNSLSFDGGLTCKDGYSLRMKTAKRSLLIFCALVSRHRKFADKYAVKMHFLLHNENTDILVFPQISSHLTMTD